MALETAFFHALVSASVYSKAGFRFASLRLLNLQRGLDDKLSFPGFNEGGINPPREFVFERDFVQAALIPFETFRHIRARAREREANLLYASDISRYN